MPRSYSRTRRVNELIQIALAEILQKEMNENPFGMITVTGVEISPDFSFAKIFVSVLMEDKAKEAILALNEDAKEYRYQLANRIRIRVTPELKFVYDDSTLRGSRISSLIDHALKKS